MGDGNPSKGKRGSFAEGSLVLGVRARVGEGARRPTGSGARPHKEAVCWKGWSAGRVSGHSCMGIKDLVPSAKVKEMRRVSPWEEG